MKILNPAISKQVLFQVILKGQEDVFRKAVLKVFGTAILKNMFLDMWQLSIQEILSDDEIYEKLAELNTELAQQKGLADAFSKS